MRVHPISDSLAASASVEPDKSHCTTPSGANSRPDNYVLGQAFWAAIFSCGLSGIVSVLLLVHFVVQRQQKYKDSIKHRVDGRHFLLSVTAFVVVIALHALAFSEIEGYVFWDGVFAAIVTCTTIGFGDLAPRHVSTKILLFVFFAVDVALLGNMVRPCR